MVVSGVRDLLTPQHRQAIEDVLTTCIVGELLAPSKELWLMSAWISDIEVLDNSAGAYCSLAPDWADGPVRLSAVFRRIAELGGHIFVGMRRHPHNFAFVPRLRDLQREFPDRLSWKMSVEEHRKCFCGDLFALRGSMNFTYYGLNANEEQLTLSTNISDIKKLQMELSDSWRRSVT